VIFALYEHPGGTETEAGALAVYDLVANVAHAGGTRVDGPALVWELGGDGAGAALAVEVELDPGTGWLARCDRVDFPPGGIAYRHVHPGPGIRRLLHGALTIDRDDGEPNTYRTGESWFEGADDPVLATASASEETAFVRVMLLPAEWAGRRTIRYVDPADEERPKLQRATVLLEVPL
jgi:quercetin dioxygenase-like cupin family protein